MHFRIYATLCICDSIATPWDSMRLHDPREVPCSWQVLTRFKRYIYMYNEQNYICYSEFSSSDKFYEIYMKYICIFHALLATLCICDSIATPCDSMTFLRLHATPLIFLRLHQKRDQKWEAPRKFIFIKLNSLANEALGL